MSGPLGWFCLVTGALMWASVLVWVIAVFVEPNSSNNLSYGCARCDWEITNPRKRRWWTLRPQYRWHCVAVHHDWPPRYTRKSVVIPPKEVRTDGGFPR